MDEFTAASGSGANSMGWQRQLMNVDTVRQQNGGTVFGFEKDVHSQPRVKVREDAQAAARHDHREAVWAQAASLHATILQYHQVLDLQTLGVREREIEHAA
mmetsp:Transcript_28624/g.46058  ORF Transcript_28624/g.46058 Transcript_28624/m.46058 type:complete len:101 (-) Transcript_28624:133-435(-)